MTKVELYQFTEVPLTTSFGGEAEAPRLWHWTSSNAPVEHLGVTYTPSTVGRTEAEVKSGMSKANMSIKADLFHEMARRWLVEAPDHTVTVTVFSKEGEDVNTEWKGRLMSLKPSASEIVMVFESVFTSLRRPGLRARYQRSCRHMLYGAGCNLNKADFQVDAVATVVTGLNVTVPIAATYPDGTFSSGIIEAPDGSMRFVVSHVGETLTLMQPFELLAKALTEDGYGMSWGMYWGQCAVKIFPGCNRSRVVCSSEFDNLLNYGGFDWIPTKNPFGGSSII